jgi:ligand-binding SRPBCC domain-containing protein
MTRFRHFTLRQWLPAPPEAVWARVVTPAGINDELFPWISMSLPAASLPAGASANLAVGRCWLRLFGVLPFDYDDLFIARLVPFAFDERSRMLTQRHWLHRRRVRAVDGGTEVVDRIGFVPSLPWLAALYLPLVSAVFRWRHRRLRRHFSDFPVPR